MSEMSLLMLFLLGVALLACGAYLLGFQHGIQLERSRQATADATRTPPAEIEIAGVFVPIREDRR